MAEQRRRPAAAQRAAGSPRPRASAGSSTGRPRPAGSRTGQPRPAGATRRKRRPTRRRSGPTRWLTPLLALVAGGVVAGSQLTPLLVDLTATSTAIPENGVTTGGSTAPALSNGMLSFSTGSAAGASGGSTTSTGTSTGLVVPQPPRPNGVTVRPWAAHGVPPTLTPREEACGGFSSPKRITPGVTPGAGSAAVDWLADNRPEVSGYRVQAVSQQLVAGAQPTPPMQTVGQPEGCVPVSTTVTGLTSGVPYVFWLEEEVTSTVTGVARWVQVGTSDAFVIG